jgi:hypothetical protein
MIIFISGCSYFNIYSDSLIFDSEKIDTMSVALQKHNSKMSSGEKESIR